MLAPLPAVRKRLQTFGSGEGRPRSLATEYLEIPGWLCKQSAGSQSHRVGIFPVYAKEELQVEFGAGAIQGHVVQGAEGR